MKQRQYQVVGTVLPHIQCELRYLSVVNDMMEFLYKPEVEKYISIFGGPNEFTGLLNITTSYNQIVSELETAKNILNYHVFGNEELSPLALHERFKNVNSYYILHEKYKLIYQAVTDAKIEQEYQEVISQLNVQEYDNGEFSITIPKTTKDIINEGKALHHCVGVYVDKVVRREDMIYFLRKDREVPYVTIEVKDKKVTQIEGDMNNRFIAKNTPEYEAIKEWARINKFTLL